VIEESERQILSLLKPSDAVLDVGGWASPFNRATHVLDAFPYETRGFYRTFGGPAFQGGTVEHFTQDTWIQRDICDRERFPFSDKSVDFVICSQVLEDVRDPLWVCSEMIRIGKRGYIEVPSRIAESCRGWEHPRIAGLSHHRWFVEIQGNSIQFLMKYYFASLWKYSFPPSLLKTLPAEQRVAKLFWEESFAYSEQIVHGYAEQREEHERFINSVRPHARAMVLVGDALERGISLALRAEAKVSRAWNRLVTQVGQR
jgi:hypothetical protein